MTGYNTIDSMLQKAQKDETGGLISRNLTPYFEQAKLDEPSDYIDVVFVVVPKSENGKFAQTYPTINDFVVPDSHVYFIAIRTHFK